MKFSKVFLPYPLATAAGLVVDEGNECQPLMVINQLEFINFIDQDPPPVELASINISPQDDLCAPLLTSAKRLPGKKHSCQIKEKKSNLDR